MDIHEYIAQQVNAEMLRRRDVDNRINRYLNASGEDAEALFTEAEDIAFLAVPPLLHPYLVISGEAVGNVKITLALPDCTKIYSKVIFGQLMDWHIELFGKHIDQFGRYSLVSVDDNLPLETLGQAVALARENFTAKNEILATIKSQGGKIDPMHLD